MPDPDAARARQLHAAGDAGGAERSYRLALERHPHDLRLRHDYAVLLMQTQRQEEAITWFEQVLADEPGAADTATALALCLRDTGQVARGREIAALATRLAPDDALAWLLAGSLAVMAGAAAEALPALQRAVALEPDLDEAWHYLGEALQAGQRWAEAAQAYRRAMASRPEEVFNIALCAERAGEWEHARRGYQAMCRLRPDRVDCAVRLAQSEAMCCRFDDEATLLAALSGRLASGTPMAPGDVPEAFPLSYLPLADKDKGMLLDRYAARIVQRAQALGGPLPWTPAVPGPRRRIGYLSADFGEHPVGDLVRGLFAAHDRAAVEVHAYSLHKHEDVVAMEIRAGAEHFHDCEALSTLQTAQLIRSHGIELLIDLSGYTAGGRPEILALRPAPRQLGWLGFIHGQQAPWLDGVLLDENVLPADAPWPYADHVLRLPAPLLPAGPITGQIPTGKPDRQRFGLPHGRVVLASFNSSYKLDAALTAAWAEILRRAPGAVLLVYLPGHARQGFLVTWRACGGDVARLILADWLPPDEQADRAASCDLFLDAFRYQAGATAIASVAAGLPILSREGDTPLARLSVSLNRFLGLDELVCADTETYVARAAGLANDPSSLMTLRQRLIAAATRQQLFDPRRMAAAIETL